MKSVLSLHASFYRTHVSLVRSMDPSVSTNSLTHRPCVNLTDVTLADEDTDSILTDNANRANPWQCGNVCDVTWWPTLESMQVVPSGGQIRKQCKWRHLVAKFATNLIGAIWWPNLLLM